MDARHQAFADALPAQPEALWDALGGMADDERRALFAHCVACSVNATFDAYNRRPRALAHADQLATAVDLDMVAAGWRPSVDNFLGRVTKARIVQAVTEAKGEGAAKAIEPLKKGDMAARAAVLLDGTGWLPEPLRTPGRTLLACIEHAAESPLIEGAFHLDPEGEAQSAEDAARGSWPIPRRSTKMRCRGRSPLRRPRRVGPAPRPAQSGGSAAAVAGPPFIWEDPPCKTPRNLRAVSPAMPRACAAIICRTGADRADTGSSAMSRAPRVAACSCG